VSNGIAKYPRLVVLGYSEAAMFLKQPMAAELSAVISIHGQREYPLELADPVAHHLTLEFDDSPAPDDSDPLQAARVQLRKREAAEIGLTLRPPTIDHARAILDFAEQVKTCNGILLCQCQAGISRSPAAALLCLAAWAGPGRERPCVEYLRQIRPASVPHPDLVRLADQLLLARGALSAAIGIGSE
jgi:predicted protein tyrosine phosphatase